MGDIGDADGLVEFGIDRLFNAAEARHLGSLAAFLRSPGAPGLRRRIARIERDQTVGQQMARGGPQHGQRICVGQEHLEGVAGEIDQIESPAEIERSRIGLDPFDPLSTRPAARDLQHSLCRIGAHHRRDLFGDAGGEHAGAAAEIENRPAGLPGKSQIEIVARPPRVERVIEARQGTRRRKCRRRLAPSARNEDYSP